jgi:hypothetical protein
LDGIAIDVPNAASSASSLKYHCVKCTGCTKTLKVPCEGRRDVVLLSSTCTLRWGSLESGRSLRPLRIFLKPCFSEFRALKLTTRHRRSMPRKRQQSAQGPVAVIIACSCEQTGDHSEASMTRMLCSGSEIFESGGHVHVRYVSALKWFKKVLPRCSLTRYVADWSQYQKR